MLIQLICPNLECRKIISVPDKERGKLVQCQHCKITFRVPPPQRVDEKERNWKRLSLML
jgi:hypothetical protein